MFKRITYVILMGAMLAFFAGCGQNPSGQDKVEAPKTEQSKADASKVDLGQSSPTGSFDLRWGTISSGGAWQVIGSAMLEDIKKENPGITGSCVPSTTTANVMGVSEGKFNIGFSLTDTTADAWQGEGYFKPNGKIQDIREVAALYPQTYHVVVGADSDINKIEDLKGKRVSPGAKGLSCDLEFQRILKLYGMSYDDMKVEFLSFDDSAQQFIDGHLDCLAYATVPPPFAPVINISSQRKIKLLSLPDDKISEMTKFQGVAEYTMEPDTYPGIDYPVKGIAVRSHIIVRQDMPDEVVYNIVKTIAENLERYQNVLNSMKFVKPEDLAVDVGIPYHPGALKYYKEKGWVQ